MKTIFFSIFIILVPVLNLLGQPSDFVRKEGYVEITNDSIKHIIYDDYRKVILNDSIVIEEYAFIPSDHNRTRKEGIYIKRSSNGIIIEIGEYQWNRKVGKWIYFFESESIRKIENYKLPFDNKQWYNLNTDLLHQFGPFLSGQYIEYFENGNLRIKGAFEVVETNRTNFTIKDFDIETYKERLITISEEYWVPTSIKVRTWNEYDESGNLIKKEEFENTTNSSFRRIPQNPIGDNYKYLIKDY